MKIMDQIGDLVPDPVFHVAYYCADTIVQLQTQIEELQDAFHKEYLQDRGPGDPEGCGDNSCMIKTPKGMATNGGCRCGRASFKRALQLVRKENETLKALINAMHEKDKLEDT